MNQEQYEAQLGQLLAQTMAKRPEFENRFYRWPVLNEDTPGTSFDSHYLYHVAWALRKVVQSGTQMHVDFSSSLNFCSTVSAFCQTRFFDFRPAQIALSNLECGHCDLTAADFSVGQYHSVSCMHVTEHIGLGRYGDTLDCDGDLKAIENLKKTVLLGGSLYFVVPCGRPSVQFNAHRVYTPHSILQYFGADFELAEFYFITGTDGQAPVTNPELDWILQFDYGCGCFHFKRAA